MFLMKYSKGIRYPNTVCTKRSTNYPLKHKHFKLAEYSKNLKPRTSIFQNTLSYENNLGHTKFRAYDLFLIDFNNCFITYVLGA